MTTTDALCAAAPADLRKAGRRACDADPGRHDPAVRRLWAPRIARALLAGVLVLSAQAFASETDQFLTWGIELRDSSDAINRYLNGQIQQVLDRVNEQRADPCDCDTVVREIYVHLFRSLLSSRLRTWLNHSPEVDRYPPSGEVSYFRHYRMSIYRKPSFPFLLPMSRTIRVGDVYCGTDKLEHFFGFGRRYYRWSRHWRAEGLSEEEALRRAVLRGIAWEDSLVGKLVDGIFSHGDLEANFQGARAAMALCEGDAPLLRLVDGNWVLTRPLDIREFVTPGFDESYNVSHYWALRRRFVLATLRKEYRDKYSLPSVQARFARYRTREPSFSQRVIEDYFAARGAHPGKAQFADVFGPPSPATASSAQIRRDGRLLSRGSEAVPGERGQDGRRLMEEEPPRRTGLSRASRKTDSRW